MRRKEAVITALCPIIWQIKKIGLHGFPGSTSDIFSFRDWTLLRVR